MEKKSVSFANQRKCTDKFDQPTISHAPSVQLYCASQFCICFMLFILPWPKKKMRQALLQTTGACMLEKSRTCARWRVPVPVFLARVVVSVTIFVKRGMSYGTVQSIKGKLKSIAQSSDVTDLPRSMLSITFLHNSHMLCKHSHSLIPWRGMPAQTHKNPSYSQRSDQAVSARSHSEGWLQHSAHRGRSG